MKKRDRTGDLFTVIKTGITLIVVFATLVGVIVISWIFYDNLFGKVPDVFVPDVINLDKVEARHKIEAQGLIMDINEVHNEEVPKDMIISQDPEGGKNVKSGRKVFVKVSLGGELINIPNLKGLTFKDAETKLNDLYLKAMVLKEVAHENIPSGSVVEQDPPAFSLLSKNGTVQLILSSGPETPRPIPELVGISFEEAKTAIEASEFILGKVVWLEDNRFSPGMVISQLPLPKEDYKPGTLVSLEVIAERGNNNILFQQDLITIMVPKAEEDVEVEVILSDRYGKGRVYYSIHKSGTEFELNISSMGEGKIEIYFDGNLSAKADL